MLCERHKVTTSFQMLRWMPGVGIVKFLHVSSAMKLTDFFLAADGSVMIKDLFTS